MSTNEMHSKLAALEESGESIYDGDLYLRSYKYALPENLKEVRGNVTIYNYGFALPRGLKTIHGHLKLDKYRHTLPLSLEKIGGRLELIDYRLPLPGRLSSTGDIPWLGDYKYPLPDSLTHVGHISLAHYDFPLPKKLFHIGGYLSLEGYAHRLPDWLKNIDGPLVLRRYEHPLPSGLRKIGGSLDLTYYYKRLPDSLKRVGQDIWLGSDYPYPFPNDLTVGGAVTGPYVKEYRGRLPKSVKYQENYRLSIPDTESFRRWFKTSQVTTPEGAAAVVYHGTDLGGFSQFDPAKIDPHHPGFYFSDDLQVASSYSDNPQWPFEDPTPELGSPDKTGMSGAYRLFLSLQNPAVVDCKSSNWNRIDHPDFPGLRKTYDIATEAKRRGYDGVIFKNIWDHGGKSGEPKLGTVYVAFYPTQIKSALFNTGEFSPTDPDIRKNPRRRKTSRRARRTSRR